MTMLTMLAFLVVAPSVVHGAGLVDQIVPQDCNVKGGCQSICDLAQLAQNVLNTAVYVAIIASAVLFAVTGFRFVTAQARGESMKMTQTRAMFMNVFLGLVLILAAWLIVDTIISFLVTGSGGLPWHQICT